MFETVYPSRVTTAADGADGGDDDDGPVYRVCAADETMFTILTCSSVHHDDDEDDFHRRYRPYQRLVASWSDRSVDIVQAAAMRLGHNDMTIIRRRLGHKSSISD